MSEWDKTIEKIRILEAERTKLLEENKQLEYETYLNREIFWAHMVDVDKKLETMTLKYKGMDSINQFNITEADKEHQNLEAIRELKERFPKIYDGMCLDCTMGPFEREKCSRCASGKQIAWLIDLDSVLGVRKEMQEKGQ